MIYVRIVVIVLEILLLYQIVFFSPGLNVDKQYCGLDKSNSSTNSYSEEDLKNSKKSFFYSNETLDAIDHEIPILMDSENIDIIDDIPLQDIDNDHENDPNFNPYKFIASLPEKPEPINLIPLLPISTLPERTTLVLDLDESLVHASLDKMENADVVFDIKDDTGKIHTVFVNKRPYLNEFLKRVSELFEVVIFTASQKIYAETLLNIIDSNSYIHHRLYRDSCIHVEGNYIKDLSKLGRDLSKVIIVDNSPHVFGYHIDNGIPIIGWFEDKKDRELEILVPFLESLSNVENVMPFIRKQYKLYEKVNQYKYK